MRIALVALAGYSIAAAAWAQPAPQTPAPDPRFTECVARIEANPEVAYEEAMRWAGVGRELPAYRCAAMALAAQERHEEAARRFESLARENEGALPALRAELFAQAGAAYMLARLPGQARSALTQAITLVQSNPQNLPDLLIDRAGAYAAERDWRLAEEDLSRALDISGPNALALRLRSTTRVHQNAFALALADAEAAVGLEPMSVEGRLALGQAREAQRLNRAPDAE